MSSASAPPVAGGGTGITDRLVHAVLDVLDHGVVVVDRALARVSFANREGARALAALGAIGDRVPASLTAALAAGSTRGLPLDRFTPATQVVAIDGTHFFVRGRRLGSPFGGGVLVLTGAQLRRADLIDLVHEQTGLSRRHCQCVALVRDGQRNREIARALGLSTGTVGQYLVEIYARLGVTSRAALVAQVDEMVHLPTLLRDAALGHG